MHTFTGKGFGCESDTWAGTITDGKFAGKCITNNALCKVNVKVQTSKKGKRFVVITMSDTTRRFHEVTGV